MQVRGTAIASLVLMALVVGGTPTGSVSGGAHPPSADAFTVSLSATPSFGTAPLSVVFEASVSSGSPTSYHWSFGDGTTLNGTNASFADPEHVFATAGTFTTQVNISEGSAYSVGTIPVHVISAPLGVTVSARPSKGVEPLTVTFRANVTGGTGTYLSLNWSFGDGSTGSGFVVQYTYERPGDFYVTVRVEDSSRATASAGTWVNLTAPADGGGTLGSVLVWALVGFALGVGVAVAVVVLRSRWGPPSALPEPTPPAPATPVVVAPVLAPATSGELQVPSVRDGKAVPSPPVLRLSQRIVVHLAGQGTLGPYEVAPVTITQGGMAAALSVRQNGLTNVLRRLVAAGIVTEELRHVVGQPRRLKVYHLTPRGELLARELRHRPPP